MLTSVNAIYKDGNVYFDEKPDNISFSKVIVTFIDDLDINLTYQAMKLSEISFEEWNNKEDEIYDTL
ncbi:MAG: hypothetical protein HW421_759 [Ignavibacteria bacterium]|nr:hypothetical protein [Ignavibacteria bacterium]